jgi:biotin transport system permease protein
MRGHAYLVGAYQEGRSPVHRAPLPLKMAVLAVVGISAFVLADPVSRTALLLAVVVLHCVAGLPAARLLGPLKAMWLFLLILAAYQWWQNGPATAWQIMAGVLACVFAANVLTATTPVQQLLDGLVAAVRPFRRLGADPERFALTIGLMLRSIPFIIGSFNDVREAAKARGLERSPRALVLPVIIGTVAYARQTGEALAARGLGEKDEEDPGSILGA